MMQEKIKIYLNPKTNNCDELCIELLQKLNTIEILEEGEAIEIIAPINPFTTNCIKLKTQVLQKLIQLRVKFAVRVENDK